MLGSGGLLVLPPFCHGETVVARLADLTGFPVVTRFAGHALHQLVARHGLELEKETLFHGQLPIRLVVARV